MTKKEARNSKKEDENIDKVSKKHTGLFIEDFNESEVKEIEQQENNMFDMPDSISLKDPVSTKRLIELQKSDNFFGPIYQYLTETNLSNIPSDKRLLYRSEYCIIDGVLCREIYVDKRANLRFCVCIPEPLEHDCIMAYHERPFSLGSHASGRFMYANMKRHIYFKHMLDKSIKFAQSCILCNRVKSLKQPQTSLQNVSTRPLGCNEVISLDYGGPFVPTKNGNVYMCLIQCLKSHFLWAYPVKST